MEEQVSSETTNAPEASSKDKPSKDKTKNKIKFENTLPRLEAVAYFEAIIESLKAGSISLTQGDDTVDLHPSEFVAVEVKASKKGTSEKVSFELEWDSEARKLEISASSDS